MRSLRNFLLRLLIGLCILACGLVGNGLYSALGQPKPPIHVHWIRAFYLFLLLMCGGTLYWCRFRHYRIHWTRWCGVFLAVIFAGAAADSWQAWMESLAGPQRQQARGPVLYSLAFFVILILVERAFRNIPPRSLIRSASPEYRAHLILFLSEIRDLHRYRTCIPDWITGNGRSLKQDLEEMALEKRGGKPQGKWSWEQPLRALHYHLPGKILKSVTVIASKESINQTPQFAALVGKYPELEEVNFKLFVRGISNGSRFADLRAPIGPSDGFDFENFTELSEALYDLLPLLTKRGLAESKIMIDFTGGQKVASVVAAAMTFNRDVRAQYVQTEEPWNVLSYSVVTAQRPI